MNTAERKATVGVSWLASHAGAWQLVFADSLGEILIDDHVLRVVVFDPLKEEVIRWIP
jgi:hypothetical protein